MLDGFGGTASVSLLFKMMGKEVAFHDGLLCNTITAKGFLMILQMAKIMHPIGIKFCWKH